jgi:hypothetical protein
MQRRPAFFISHFDHPDRPFQARCRGLRKQVECAD